MAAASLWLAPARADDPLLPQAVPDYTGLLAQYLNPADHRDARNGFGAGALAGFRLRDSLALELKLYGDDLDRDGYRSRPYVIGGGADFRASERHGLFLLGGFGVETGSVDNTHRVDPYLEAGAGVQRHLFADVSLRLEGGYRLLPSLGRGGGFGGEGWAGVGLVFDWPGRPRAVALPAPAAASVGVVTVQCPPAPEGLDVDASGVLVAQDRRPVELGFVTASAALDEAAQAQIARLAAALNCGPAQQLAVQLAGHADVRGGELYNVGLSARRAAAVRDGLIRAGVSPARLGVVAEGEYDPLVPGRGSAALAANRRIELTLYPGVAPVP